MSNSTILRVVILGTFAIIGILAMQSWWIWKSFDSQQTEFDQSVRIALRKVAKIVTVHRDSEAMPATQLITQATGNYYVVNVNDKIDPAVLEFQLKKELEAVALHVDFEYGIFDCTSKDMIYGNFISYANDKGEREELDQKLPSQEGLDHYFGIRFPGRTSYLLSTMSLVWIFSGLLLVAMVFFAYAMSVILQQKRLSELQKDFINNMTHEFKTPISTIRVAADTFLNSPVVQQEDRLQRYARILREQSERLTQQVEKVLQIAKVDRLGFQLNREPVQVHELLGPLLQSVDAKVTDAGGALHTQLGATAHLIQADPVHFTNVLDNLLDNALKYSPENPQVSVSTANPSPDVLVISIRDNGIGIAKNFQKKVFNKFFRVPTGNIHNVKGFGLGLYYVRNICQQHGWKIQLDSEPGKGTTVQITIPQATRPIAIPSKERVA